MAAPSAEQHVVRPAGAGARPFTPHPGRGLLFVLLSAVSFSSSGVLAKPVMLAGMTPQQVAAARIGLAAAILLAGVALVRPSLLKVRRGDWPLLVGFGLLGVAGAQLMYFVAASRIPVGVAILLEFTSPVLVALWVRFVRRVHMPRALYGGVALAMLGLALVAQVWQGLRLDLLGMGAGLLAAVCASAYFLLGERGMTAQHPLGMVTWGLTFGALTVCAAAPPWTWPAEKLTMTVPFGPWTPPAWLLLVAVAVVSTVLAYLTGLFALRHLPAAVASALGLVEPLAATALAWVLIDEALTLVQLVGAVAVLAGATIVQLNSPGKTQPGTPAEPLPDPDHCREPDGLPGR
ncbi:MULTISPECIES: EamA family transporter [Thermocrispum]|uniref:EamA family transporter n=1 Tax=Thermocrispum agreste TaxID=37925 RepID=A0A2W4JK04_9PSEU|nr:MULTISPECIES: EamA family transporter [Thermocrispum]PZM98821.1 MAG: EamA family transporter [Thermocrispum agreste]